MNDPIGPVIRVLVADDHALFREGVIGILSRESDLAVVGEADDGPTAVARCAELQPDVVLLDIAMPGMNGIDAIRHVLDAAPGSAVVMLTMLEDDASLGAALQAGARGYLLKGVTGAEVARTVRAVAAGDAHFGRDVAGRLGRLLGGSADRVPFPELTDREREILALLAEGRSNAVIGRHLSISAKTVANHVSSILLKLRLSDRAAAALRAREAGFGAYQIRPGGPGRR